MVDKVWVWRPPPGWPEPPPGWYPTTGWGPPAHWPPPPPGWQFWAEELPPVAVEATGTVTRSNLAWETVFVMVAFLASGVVTAVTIFARHAFGAGNLSPIPDLIPAHPVANMVFAILGYLPVAAVVPLGLLLLARTGQRPAALGLDIPGWSSDIWPALGLLAAAFGVSFLLAIPLAPVLRAHPALDNPAAVGHVPAYYVIWGLVVSATTAVTEEVLVNGYFLTRLEQLGWKPQHALILSLALRTSYHVYYGIGFVFTIPFGYFMTRSFQKNRRLTRPIVAHFIWDAVLFTVAILTS